MTGFFSGLFLSDAYNLNNITTLSDTLISEGFQNNEQLYDDSMLLKVRLNSILNNEIGTFFNGDKFVSPNEFITNLERRIDCYIEMLTEDKYVGYEKGAPNKNNIFGKNEVSFKKYESIINYIYLFKKNKFTLYFFPISQMLSSHLVK